MRRSRSVPLTALTCLALALGAGGAAEGRDRAVHSAPGGRAAACTGGRWITAWGASPSYSGSAGIPSLSGRTVRTVVTPLTGATRARVTLSNRFGSRPFTAGAVSVGRQKPGAGAALGGGSLRRVTFGGEARVTIPPGGEVTSDRIKLRFSALQRLAVSVFVPRREHDPPTRHLVGNQTSYISGHGNRTLEPGAGYPFRTTERLLVSRITVRAPASAATVVAFGDSITDGYQDQRPGPQGIDADTRYPDFLARRLVADAPARRFGVANAGIGGNRILGPGIAAEYGPSAGARLARDAVTVPGATTVILLEGINDIQQRDASGQAVIGGLKRLVRRLNDAGLRVLLGTLTPMGGEIGVTAAQERARQIVNRWIRRQHTAFGVTDFDRALRDPQAPKRLRAKFDSGDHLHPSAAGYAAMAGAISPADLRPGCIR